MKRTAALFLVFAAAVAAHAGELIDPSGNFVSGLPGRIVADGIVISPVTLADALAAGYRLPTETDYAARAEAEAASQAQAEAEAANSMPDPQTKAPIVSNGVKVGTASIVVDDVTRMVIATDDEHSPKHTKGEQLGQFKTKSDALMATTRSKNFNEFIAAWSNYVTAK